MKGFDVKFMDELKNKNDIVDVIGRYVRLEQRGGNFWGKCPFHHEKTASFSVNSTEQFYYCFGCHKSGDVISFIREIESLDFGDAVKFLAERAHMPLPEINYDDEKVKEQKKLRERLLSLLRDTALFYVENLKSENGKAHYDYALNRKLSANTIVKFGMGASLNFNDLPNFLRKKGYTEQEMVLSGAVGEKNGRYFDWLGGRLIIPAIDQFGNVIAFVGRRIDGIKEQKYINTKETSVFSKGKTFFNINNLKKLKNEKGLPFVIMVEGHLDVVSLSQAGFSNVVATMGTALTKEQARMIKRYTDKIVISYDGDFAGQKATVRGLDILSEEGLEVKVARLPDGMDPDDVIKKLGAEGYQKIIDQAMPLIDFKLDLLRRTYDVNTVDGKRKYVTMALNVVRESASSAEQEDLLKVIRDQTKITFEALKRELYSLEQKPREQKVDQMRFNDNVGDRATLASRFVLASYLFDKAYAKENDLEELEFNLPVHKEIQSYILKQQAQNEKVRFSDLYELFSEEYEEEISRIAGLEAEDKSDLDFGGTYFFDCVRTLKKDAINHKIEKLTEMCAKETDLDKRKELTAEMMRLLQEKRNLI